MAYAQHILRQWAYQAVCFVLCPVLLSAQGWQRFHGGAGNDRAFALRILPDASIVVAGSSADSLGGATNWYFLRADSAGHVLTAFSWGDSLSDEAALSILPDANGGWFLCGSQYRSVATPLGFEVQGAITGVDAFDTPLPVLSFEPFTAFNSAETWADDYLLVGAKYFQVGIDSYSPRFFSQKNDASGNPVWQRSWDFGQYSEAETALVLPDGNAVVAGAFFDTPNLFDILVLKMDAAGDTLSSLILRKPGNQRSSDLLARGSGNLLLVGNDGLSAATTDILLAELSPELDTLWTRRLPIPGFQQAYAAIALPNGNIALAGEHIPEGSNSRDGLLALTDSLGNLLWFKTYGGLKGDILWDLQAATDGNGFILAGQTASHSPGGDLQAWLLRTDSLGTVWSNRVIGRVTRDVVQNCMEDPLEPMLPGWFVAASGAPGTLYTITDDSGRYSMELDTGAWFVSVLPIAGYWSPCEDSLQLQIMDLGDTLAIDVSVQALYQCPLLDVDLSTPYLRRCFENTFTLRYFNYGTAPAPDAVITVELDPYLSLTGSELPYSQSGDTLFFPIGLVESLQGGSFQFTALLDCDDTVLGQTHCSVAHIFPDSLCYDFDPEWDGSQLEVSGYCQGDSVILTITNTGLGMQSTVGYIIIEDQIIFKNSLLQLGAGQDTTFVLHPGGATVTIIVEQSPGHPGNSQPMLVIEGCGGFPFSTGYVLQFPQNDGDFSTDIECRQNIGSYDPNDKSGVPEGVGAERLIAPSTTIEYLIRFQNTGTDTAFRVEIRDTLPATLDLASFKKGASSHPYQLDVSGFGVLSFLFDPIALPDSGANLAASQGFVKFKISPKKGLPLGTKIESRASIYFDQNAPIHTNQTLHTLGNPFQSLITVKTEPVHTTTAEDNLVIAPNPVKHGYTTVSLTQPLKSEGLRLEVLDAMGRRLWQSAALAGYQAAAGWAVDLGHLAPGLYLVVLKTEEGKMLANGKVVRL